MADYTPARLHIGGEITAAQYRTIQALTDDGAEVVWGSFYGIWHDQAPWGAFGELEAYLVEQQIAFDRYSEPALGCDGGLAQYRPGMPEPREFLVSGDNQERLIPVSALQAVLAAYPAEGTPGEALMAQLGALCGPVIAPLLPFRVRLV